MRPANRRETPLADARVKNKMGSYHFENKYIKPIIRGILKEKNKI